MMIVAYRVLANLVVVGVILKSFVHLDQNMVSVFCKEQVVIAKVNGDLGKRQKICAIQQQYKYVTNIGLAGLV